MNENYYDILGVSSSATDDEIKKAYRKLAIENHPDRHPGDKNAEEKFKKINEAYSTLSNKSKRDQYDNSRHQGNTRYNSSFTGNVNPNDINDIFEKFFHRDFGNMDDDIFGASHFSSNYRQRENLNISLNIRISFEEAYRGCEKTISFKTTNICDSCKGSGYDSSSKYVKCNKCNGSGYVVERVQGLYGNPTNKRVVCPECNGKGTHYEKHCNKCNGSGCINENKTITIKIQKGTYDGMQQNYRGFGKVSKFGERGDLILFFTVPNYSINGVFSRINGFDMKCNIGLSYYELICGCIKTIELPNGEKKTFKIPKNINPNTEMKLKGYGFKLLTGGLNSQSNGDLFINVKLNPVGKLSKEQEELLKKFDDLLKK